MNIYRTHTCNALSLQHEKQEVVLSGWIYRLRHHRSILFIDLCDHYGITQVVFTEENSDLLKNAIEKLKLETLITIKGTVQKRSDDTVNTKLITGEIEVTCSQFDILSQCEELPFAVNRNEGVSEDLRLQYRFLDLRREKLQNNIILRSKVMNDIEYFLVKRDFLKIHTPILANSSPEGANDFLVPSRLHKGKFYALPQAPQIFKQMLMVSRFDKYFQIAPCFRDEDLRADRIAEFYQIDIEMSFVEEEDIFRSVGDLLYRIFTKFGDKQVNDTPFPKITYNEALEKYGTDKPDLRNPIFLSDGTHVFAGSKFEIFKNKIAAGAIVKMIPAPKTAEKPRSFFDNMIKFAIENGAGGMAYIGIKGEDDYLGPISKLLTIGQIQDIAAITGVEEGDSVFFICEQPKLATQIAAVVRTKLAEQLDLIKQDQFMFCWITHFPMFEWNDEDNKIDFCHNPFSMPIGGKKALEEATTREELLAIQARQYDIVCNGTELSSGAIRNHDLGTLYKAFAIVGYTKQQVDAQFSSLVEAFKYSPPPHGGIAPGFDRIMMLLTNSTNLREVTAFPLNQSMSSKLLQTPSSITPAQLDSLGLTIKPDNDSKNEKGEDNKKA